MTFASADRVQLAYIAESVPGTTPTTGNGRKLRMTGESLAFDLTKTDDNEISADGQPSSSTTVNATAGGDINLHVQYAEYDPFVAGVLRSAWVEFGTDGVSATFDADFTATTITADVAPTGSSAFTNLQRGQWFRLNAPTTEFDGELVRVSPTVSPTATVITLDAATPLEVDTATGCTISTSRLANGVDLTSFTIEKQATDVDEYFAFRGMHPSKLSLSFASESDTTGSISFMGYDAENDTVTALPGTLQESQTYDIHNGVVGVGQLWEGGAPTTASVKSLSFDADSGLRYQTALGTLGAVGIGIGTFSASGSITVYFENGALYQKYEGDVYTSLIFSTLDTQGNGYVITLPRVMLSQGRIVAGGKNTDLMAEFQFSAKADRANTIPALRKTVFIDRVGAAVTV